MAAIPRTIGSVPKEYREIFELPFPTDQGIKSSRYGLNNARHLTGSWEHDEPISADVLEPHAQLFLPVIADIVNLGGLAVSKNTTLNVDISQGGAIAMAAGNDAYHPDKAGISRKVIVSNMYGTWYQDAFGDEHQTKDFEYLLMDGATLHKADIPGQDRIRTVLSVVIAEKTLRFTPVATPADIPTY